MYFLVTIFIVFGFKSKQNLIKIFNKLKHQQNLLEEMDSIIQNRGILLYYFNLASKKLKSNSNFSDSLIYNKIKSSKQTFILIIILSMLGFIILFFTKNNIT